MDRASPTSAGALGTAIYRRVVVDGAAAAGNDSWSGTVALGRGLVVYVGPGSLASSHRHDAIQLAWCPSRALTMTTDAVSTTARALLVQSRRPHTFDAGGEAVGVVLLEPSGRLGRRLAEVAERLSAADIEERLAGSELPTGTDAGALVEWGRSLIARVVGADDADGRGDVRADVLVAQRFIDDGLHDGVPQVTEVARHVGVSARQLRRAFADDVGIPFRRYVLWRRLRRALLAVRDGADLTTAAATAGFADSAHFSRTFRQSFGLAPSDVLPLVAVAEADFPGA